MVNGNEHLHDLNSKNNAIHFCCTLFNKIRFWSRIMKEHSLFLKLGFRADDTQLIAEATQFYHVFEQIEKRSHTFTNQTDPEQIRRFNSEVQQAATHIFALEEESWD